MPTDNNGPNAVHDISRLAALDGLKILDTPAEQGFDDIAHLACQACATPVALVSLVAADRQWFKANVGFPRGETDLNSSVCAHALSEPDLLVLPDLTADPRTARNLLVTGEPLMRFYAGAPLRLSTGEVVGSLCVIDKVPRPGGLTVAQADALRRLGRQVVAQIELRRSLGERDAFLAEQQAFIGDREAQTRTQVAISASGGDLNAILKALVSGAMEALPVAEAGVMELIDGDELEYRAVKGTIARHLGLRVPMNGSLAGHCALTEKPLLIHDALNDGRTRADLVRMLDLRSAIFAPVSRGGKVLGVLKLQSSKPHAFAERDLDLLQLFAGLASSGLMEAREAEAQRAVLVSDARYRAVFDSATDYAIVIMDLKGCVTNWNAGAAKVLGWSAEEMHGQTVERIFTPEDREAGIPESEMQSALVTGRGLDERWHLRKGGERFFALGEMMPLRYDGSGALGFVKILRDRTEQQRLLDRLKSSERHKAALVELGDRLRDLTAVPDIALAAADVLGHALGVELVGYGVVDPSAETLTVERDWAAGGSAGLAGTLNLRDFGSYIDDLRKGETVIVTDARTDIRTAGSAAALEARNARAFVNMPVFERGAFVALLYVSTGHARSWSDPELGFIRDIADRVRTATARVQAEHQQDVLNQELSHRLKNTLAMVQAIAAQTLRGVTEKDAVEAFKDRLTALSEAQDLLLQQSWAAAPVDAVVEAALALHGDRNQIDIQGPRLLLNARAVLSLTLLLHELATNAVKYGALSSPGGTVRLRWVVEGRDAEATITMSWTEDGGPPVAEPSRRGFGSRLVRMGLAGTGDAELRYRPAGLQVEFRAPLNVVTDQ